MAATELVESGAAEMVALTLGAQGAVLATKEGVIRRAGPKVENRSAVGAGDSFLSAMTLGLCEGRSPQDAFLRGIAAGAAAVLDPGSQLHKRADVERIYRELRAAA
jgi:6-phosphofructokinase 2